MEIKKFYNEYESVIKTGIKTVGYSAGALLAGKINKNKSFTFY
jgi:hypothetical protein